jgi:hypothetical protein
MVVLLLTGSVAMAAEYIVQEGDDLEDVAKFTCQTTEELIIMNDLEHRSMPGSGSKMIYVGDVDREMALSWYDHINLDPKQLSAQEIYKRKQNSNFLIGKVIVYKQNNPNGIYFKELFHLRDLWMKNYDEELSSAKTSAFGRSANSSSNEHGPVSIISKPKK